MSKVKPMQAWVAEVSRVVRMPSWIAGKGLSTRPPTPSTPSAAMPSSSPAAPDVRDAVPPVVVTLPEPPPPAAVDLTTSIALAQLAEDNAALRAQIAEMVATMAGLRRQVLAASEKELIQLALTIAARVVGRELTSDPHLVVAWARDAIEALAAKDDVVIAVARDVSDAVRAVSWDAPGVDYSVQIDAQLASGIIEVRAPEGKITTGAEARLAAVAEALEVVES